MKMTKCDIVNFIYGKRLCFVGFKLNFGYTRMVFILYEFVYYCNDKCFRIIIVHVDLRNRIKSITE